MSVQAPRMKLIHRTIGTFFIHITYAPPEVDSFCCGLRNIHDDFHKDEQVLFYFFKHDKNQEGFDYLNF